MKNIKKIDFNKPFAMIDPIDGTENFFAQNNMYGTLISINSIQSIKIDLILFLIQMDKIQVRFEWRIKVYCMYVSLPILE